MRVTELRCDRCGTVLENKPYLRVVLQHHHPRALDICKLCEGSLTLWLATGEELENILERRVTGDGYPTQEQIARYKAGEHV